MKSFKFNKERIKRILSIVISLILTLILFNFLFATTSFVVVFALFFLALTMSISNIVFLAEFLKHRYIYSWVKPADIIKNNLSEEYRVIYLNTECLKPSAIPLHKQRTYMAKLGKNGDISIRIETNNSDEYFEEQTSDYSWFLTMFRFNE